MTNELNDLELSVHLDGRYFAEVDECAEYRSDLYAGCHVEHIRVKARRIGATRWLPKGSVMYVHDSLWLIFEDGSSVKLEAGEKLVFNETVALNISNRNLMLPVTCTIIQKRKMTY